MRIAAFNPQNLFDRAKAFNEPDDTARRVLADIADLNALFEWTTTPSDASSACSI